MVGNVPERPRDFLRKLAVNCLLLALPTAPPAPRRSGLTPNELFWPGKSPSLSLALREYKFCGGIGPYRCKPPVDRSSNHPYLCTTSLRTLVSELSGLTRAGGRKCPGVVLQRAELTAKNCAFAPPPSLPYGLYSDAPARLSRRPSPRRDPGLQCRYRGGRAMAYGAAPKLCVSGADETGIPGRIHIES